MYTSFHKTKMWLYLLQCMSEKVARYINKFETQDKVI